MFESGKSIRGIARELNVSPSKVLRWTTRHDNGEPLSDRPRSGRPRCTTIDEDVEMVNQAIENPMTKRGAAGIAEEVGIFLSNGKFDVICYDRQYFLAVPLFD